MKKQNPYSKKISYVTEESKWVSEYDVVWKGQSCCSRDSMPLGDGDTGYNVWVEKENGLYLLIGRSDTKEHNKLGRIHITTEPDILGCDNFTQRLRLEDGYIQISTIIGSIKIWVDADGNFPELSALHIEGKLKEKVRVFVTYELWREFDEINDPDVDFDELTSNDNILNFNSNIIWCHHHPKYGCNNNMVVGGEIIAKNFEKVLNNKISSINAISDFIITTYIFADDMNTPKAWYDLLIKQKIDYEKLNLETHFNEHKNWWNNFWGRSKIIVSKAGIAHRINSQYLLQRYIFACSSRGLLPSLYNGSIFRTEIEKDSVMAFGWEAEEKTNADMRPWKEAYMGQNTRHQYWPLIASGDYDLMEPLIRLIRGRIKYQLKETWETMGHKGGFITEQFWDCGFSWNDSDLQCLPEENRNSRACESWENKSWHLQYHFLATIEFVAMFLDLYTHNTDEKFLKEIVLPCLDACIDFYDSHYPNKNENGKRIVYPAGTAETYGKARSGYHDFPQREDVTNPISEIAGLRYVISRTLKLSDSEITEKRRKRLEQYFSELPEIPTKIYGETTLLAPGEKYSPGLLCESNELYAVWPFRQNTFYSDIEKKSIARQSFFTRRISLDGSSDIQFWETGGWHPAGLDAATLGLPKEAGRILKLNYSDTLPTISIIENVEYKERPKTPRFAGFWNHPHMDGIPDQCHGGVSMNILHTMLLQWDDEKIYLLPAWQNNWDVEFKLFAPLNTIVECSFVDGRIKTLKVTPEHRLKDVVNCQTAGFQIKNIIEIRANDRNSFFNLPPMRDGLLTRDDLIYQPILKPWLLKYSQSIMNVDPYFINFHNVFSLYKDNIIYLHVFVKTDKLSFPINNFNVINVESLTGGDVKYTVKENELDLDISKCEEDIVTIIKITTDKLIEPVLSKSNLLCKYTASSCLSDNFTVANITNITSKDFWLKDINDDEPWVCCEFENVESIRRAEIRLKTDDVGVEKRLKVFVEYLNEKDEWIQLFNTVIFSEFWAQKFEEIKAKKIRFNFEKGKDFGIRFLGVF